MAEYGLLGDINFDSPEQQGLLSAGLAMLAASGSSDKRRTLGEILGAGGMHGMEAYNKRKRAMLLEDENRRQNEELKALQEHRKAQAEHLLSQRQEAQRIQGLLTQAVSPTSPGEAMAANNGPTNAALDAVGRPKSVNYQMLIAQGVPPALAQALAESQNYGKQKVARTVEVDDGAGGKKIVQVDEFGRPAGDAFSGYVKPEAVNQGDRVTFARPTAGTSMPINLSPFQSAEIGIQRGNLGVSQARLGIDREKAARDRWTNDLTRGVQVNMDTGATRPIIGEDGKPVGIALKPIPTTVNSAIQQNMTAVQKIDAAINEVKLRPQSFGLQNIMGDEANQRSDPGGIKARAAVGAIGSQRVHDLSGAAVTLSEAPRLKPFIPFPTDNDKTVLDKLQKLREEYMIQLKSFENVYSPDQGYRPFPMPDLTPTEPPQTTKPSGNRVKFSDLPGG